MNESKFTQTKATKDNTLKYIIMKVVPDIKSIRGLRQVIGFKMVYITSSESLQIYSEFSQNTSGPFMTNKASLHVGLLIFLFNVALLQEKKCVILYLLLSPFTSEASHALYITQGQ